MADPEDPPNPFPDVSHKLSAPKKLSQFEKERQAAQAKEKRAEAENAAALKAFQDSFADGDDDDYDGFPPFDRGRRREDRGFGGRYEDSRGGMGMGSGPGSLGPPPSLKRKRALDEMREMQEVRRGHDGMMGGGMHRSDPREGSRSTAREDEEDVEVDDAPRPTIQLSNLPPSSTEDDIRVLLGGLLDVHSVKFLPPPDPRFVVAKLTSSAIATLASDVSTSQIDTAVTTLKERYLGSGFYLSISRHLSSAAMHPSIAPQTSITTPSSEPFGAEKPRDRYNNPRGGFSMRNAPPPMEHQNHRFAPPDSFDNPSSRRNNSPARLPPPEAIVHPHPPPSLAQIQAIHTLVDRLLLEPSPQRALQMESLLMSLPEVQSDERFAFLYDAKSTAGVYYRYLLWSSAEEGEEEEVREMKRRLKGQERLFEDAPLDWDGRSASVPFLNLKELKEVVTDVDYISSDEEEDEEDEGAAADSENAPEGRRRFAFLTPLKKARLVHLLSRMPTSNAKLRKGDVARVTNFAINHAGAGAEEIVDLLLLNVEMPFSYSLASKYEDDSSEHEQDEDDIYEPNDDLSNLDSPAPQVQKPDSNSKREGADDPSNAKLIALYTISDILSASSTAGARNAWKYRALFEHGFREQKTFAHLGGVEKEVGWGKMRAEQWKRRIGTLLGLWEGWSVFPGEVLEDLRAQFFGAMAGSGVEGDADGKVQGEAEGKEAWMSKFKRVEQTQSPAPAAPSMSDEVDGKPMDGDIEGRAMDDEDVDGKPMDEDVDGIPMDDIDGAPMIDDDDVDGAPMTGLDVPASDEGEKVTQTQTDPEVTKVALSTSASSKLAVKQPPGPRRRMRAEDMFADSDEE